MENFNVRHLSDITAWRTKQFKSYARLGPTERRSVGMRQRKSRRVSLTGVRRITTQTSKKSIGSRYCFSLLKTWARPLMHPDIMHKRGQRQGLSIKRTLSPAAVELRGRGLRRIRYRTAQDLGLYYCYS